ncbi:MAG TPA: DUF2325 domain-containing protein [Janthinobacterium sp.]|nr:DUF2325 domain-containing protein [Janthinobacterium sp.]
MRDQHAPGEAAGAPASRRRRVWDLSQACHCPLVGVGLPLACLRKLVGKATGGRVIADDYEVHVGAVSECGSRNRLSEALQKELERRYAPIVLRFRAARNGAQVAQLWADAMAKGDVAGAFWAGLSHPRCDAALEERMCRDLHMVQHQAGACLRADMDKFGRLIDENASLGRELAESRLRGQALLLEKTTELARHDALLMQARALAIGKDSAIDALRAELAQLRAAIPGLASRQRLAQRLSQMDERERELRMQLAEWKQPAPRPAAAAALPVSAPPPAITTIHLLEQSVLCVGGRSGNVASYRAMIERVGAQFSHHDGGLEDNARMLDSSLAAADLVICQSACISHGAYWRVKEHCKRTGKRCVFIDNPSISSLERGLREAGAETA